MDQKRLTLFLIMFVSGLTLALTSSILLFLGILPSGIASVIGIVGIGLIGASGSYIAATSKRK